MDEDSLRSIWKKTYQDLDFDGLQSQQSYVPKSLSELKETISGEQTLEEKSRTKTDSQGSSSDKKLQLSTPTLGDEESFELIEEIGQGGMGVVYRAYQKTLRREVAIKKKRPQQSSSTSNTQSFLSESLITGLLEHPNIVPVHDLDIQDNGDALLAMKLVSGQEWKERLRNRASDRSLTLDDHIQTLCTVCNAIKFAHSKGILHLDLKPENIMIGEFGEILVMDWGLAVSFHNDDPRSFIPKNSSIKNPLGTPRYMAPELAEGRGEDFGPWTDVYLLGGILYEILMGEAPHRGQSLIQVILCAAQGEQPPFSEQCPGELVTLCKKALSKDREERFQSVTEFQEALESFQKHRESYRIAERGQSILNRSLQTIESHSKNELRFNVDQRDLLYSDFADSIASFKQAKFLWEGNVLAVEGELKARKSYAQTALEWGDLGLAEAQLPFLENDSAFQRLSERLATSKLDRERTETAARRQKTLVSVALLIILAVTAVGLFLVNAEKEKVETKNTVIQSQNEEIEEKNENLKKTNQALLKESFDKERENFIVRCQTAEFKVFQLWRQPRGQVDQQSREALSLYSEIAKLLSSLKRFEKKGGVDKELLTVKAELERNQSSVKNYLQMALREFQDVEGLVFQRKEGFGKILSARYSPSGDAILASSEAGLLGLWSTKSKKAIQLFLGHRGPVLDCAFSADGRWILSASADKTARLWDRQTGQVIHRFEGHAGGLTGCAFSPDSTQVLTSSNDGTLKLWDSKTGRLRQTLTDHEGAVNCCDFSKDGQFIVSGSKDRTLKIWNSQNGKLLKTLRDFKDEILSCDISPNSQFILSTARDRRVKLWNLKTGTLEKTLSVGHCYSDCVFSSNGKMAAGVCYTGIVNLWEIESGELIKEIAFDYKLLGAERARLIANRRELAHSRGPTVVMSGDGERVLLSFRLQEWEWKAKKQKLELDLEKEQVLASHFLDGGQTLLTVTANNTLQYWDCETGKLKKSVAGPRGFFFRQKFVLGGAVILSEGNSKILWEVESGKVLKRIDKGRLVDIEIAPDGREMLSTSVMSRVMGLRNLSTDELVCQFKGHAGFIWQMAFSPDNKRVLSASEDGSVKLWNRQSGELIHDFKGHGLAVMACEFSPSGQYIATAGRDRTIRVWDSQSFKEVYRFYSHSKSCYSLSFSPNGDQLLALSLENSQLWDLQKNALGQHYTEEASPFSHWSKSGDRLVLGSSGGFSVWKTNSMALVRYFQGGASPSTQFAMTPTNEELVSFSMNGELKSWDVKSGLLKRQFVGHKGRGAFCAVSMDGTKLLSSAKDRRLILWDFKTGGLVKEFQGVRELLYSGVFAPDQSEILTASRSNYFYQWNINDGKLIRKGQSHPQYDLLSCAYSADGQFFLTTSRDLTMKLWNRKNGRLLKTFEGHKDWVISCAFSPDGRWALSGSKDKTMKLWDTQTGSLVFDLKGHKKMVYYCGFSKDGSKIYSGTISPEIRVWDSKTGSPMDVIQYHDGKTYQSFLSGHQGGVQSVLSERDGSFALWRSYSNYRLEDIVPDFEEKGEDAVLRTIQNLRHFQNTKSPELKQLPPLVDIKKN